MQVERVPIVMTEDRDVEPKEVEVLWNTIPRLCPITGKRLYMIVEHYMSGLVPVYGEPNCLSTIPTNEGGSLVVDVWDHGQRTWQGLTVVGHVELI